jgi:histidinol dehydrogenase
MLRPYRTQADEDARFWSTILSNLGYVTSEGFEKLKETTKTLAEYEGFPAHKLAIQQREFLL